MTSATMAAARYSQVCIVMLRCVSWDFSLSGQPARRNGARLPHAPEHVGPPPPAMPKGHEHVPGNERQQGPAQPAVKQGGGFHHPFNAPLKDRKSTRLNSSHVAISYAV